MPSTPTTRPQPSHETLDVDGTDLHVVRAGTTGSPLLLLHGFPETSWTFHRVLPLLAADHRVVAVDLPGFGDSGPVAPDATSASTADLLHRLVDRLGLGPVHLLAQDVAGATVVRLATAHPSDVRSLVAVEAGLPGFGLEAFADVTHGGSWHIGALTAPGVPETFLAGRERELLRTWFATMTAVPGAVTEDDLDELARGFARPDGWRGATALYRSMLSEGEELRALLTSHPLTVPVLAVGGGGGPFTAATMQQVTAGEVVAVQLDGVGHHVALEAPERLAETVLRFLADVDGLPLSRP